MDFKEVETINRRMRIYSALKGIGLMIAIIAFSVVFFWVLNGCTTKPECNVVCAPGEKCRNVCQEGK